MTAALRREQLRDIENRRTRGQVISVEDLRIEREARAELEAAEATGSALLADVYAWLGRFVAYPSEAAHVAHVLWIAHTHLMDAWASTPRLAFLSPEPGSGKSRALEVSEPLVPAPVQAVNVSPAYLFRKVGESEEPPTILFDEIDTVFGPRAKENEEIRGLLNAGHRKGACAGRCVMHGKQVHTEEIPAYAAVALAGLGGLPDTILSRAVVIKMRRRAPGERVEPYRQRIHAPQGRAIGERLAQWAAGARADIEWPEIPAGVEDRDADVWEALLAVADVAGADWPRRARDAAVYLVNEAKEQSPSLGVLLLNDLRAIFRERDAMPTEDILEELHNIEESPWGDLKGKPLDARGLANRLRRYGVKPKQIRVGVTTKKGYTREALHDAWRRYLPAVPPISRGRETSETSETGETNHEKNDFERFVNGSDVSDEAKHGCLSETSEPSNNADVSSVSDVSLPAETEEYEF